MIATIAAVEFVLWFTLWNVHLCHGSDVNGSYSEQKPGSASRSTAPKSHHNIRTYQGTAMLIILNLLLVCHTKSRLSIINMAVPW